MDDRNLIAEQLRSIERWENERGKITLALRFMAGSQIGIIRNEEQPRRNLLSQGKTGAGRRSMFGQDAGWYNEAQ